MLNKLKKFISLFLISGIIFQVLGLQNFVNANDTARDTLKTEVRLLSNLKNTDGSDKLEYYTGESLTVYSDYIISTNSNPIPNAKLVVSIPEENLNETILKFGDTASDIKPIISKENGFIKATYNYDILNGGEFGSIPFTFGVKNNVTPNNFLVPVKLELLDGNNSVLVDTTKNFNFITRELTPFKHIGIDYYDSSRAYLVSGQNHRYSQINGKSVFVSDLNVFDGNNLNTGIGEKAPYVEYEIGFQVKDGFGIKFPEKFKIIDKLPEGAIPFGNPDPDGKYKGWFWNKEDNTMVYEKGHTYESGGVTKKRSVFLKLSFPNLPFEKIHENRATIIGDPGTENEKVYSEVYVNHKWEPKIVTSIHSDSLKKRGNSNFFDELKAPEEIPLNYTIEISNTKNIGETFFLDEIIDFGLDDRMYFSSIHITDRKFLEKMDEVGYNIIGVKKDESEVILGDKIEYGKHFILNDTNDIYEKIIIRFNSSIEITNNSSHSINIYANVKKEFWNINDLKPYIATAGFIHVINSSIKIYNNVSLKYKLLNNDILDINSSGYGYYYYYSDKSFFSIGKDNDYNFVYGNNENILNYKLKIDNYSEDGKDYSSKNGKIIVLLPSGLDYLGVQKEEKFYTFDKKIENFKGTGKTALIFNISNDATFGYREISLNLSVGLNTKEGENNIESYFTWDNNNEISSLDTGKVKALNGHIKYKDDLDLDNDGDNEEFFAKTVSILNFIPPREVISSKYVSIDKENWQSELENFDIGSDIYYKIKVYNNSLREAVSINFIDVLPYVGDKSIVSNQAGEYTPRESTFPIKLKKSIESIEENAEFLEKFDILYSVDGQGETLEASRNANFVTKDEIKNFADVKMIKFVLKDGKSIGVKEELSVILEGKIPNDKTLTTESKAVNSVAISKNVTEYAESNIVTSKIVKYKVSGKIFLDENKNGKLDETERILPGYKVQLMNKDGSEAKFENKNVEIISDEKGEYNLPVYKRGEYFLRIYKKNEKEEFTKIYDLPLEENDISNEFSDSEDKNYGKTGEFILNPENLFAIKNAGFILNFGSLSLIKKGIDGKILEGVKFRIEKDGEKVGESKFTNAEGKITFENLILGTYKLIEEETKKGYILDNNPITFEIEPGNLDLTKEVINEKQKWNLKIVKTNKTGKKLEGAIFELQDLEGQVIGNEKTTNNLGEILFEDLEYNDYKLVEKKSPRGYEKLKNPIIISKDKFLSDQKEIVETVINGLEKRNIKIIKTDEYGNKLSGVKFELQDSNGKVLKTETTNKTGEIIFKNIEYGTYKIVEKETLEGFKLKEEIIIGLDYFNDSKNTIEIPVVNEKEKRNIKIIKTDEYGNKLSGVKFELQDSNGKVLKTETTSEIGEIIFENIEYGIYKIVEKETLEGFKLKEEIIIGLDYFKNSKDIIEIPVVNEKEKRNIKIIKTDEYGNKLEGAVFELQNSKGEKIGETKITPYNGEIIFENIEFGDYKLFERQAPIGYSKVGAIDISKNKFLENKTEIVLTVKNKIEGSSPSIPKIIETPNVEIVKKEEEPKKENPPKIEEPKKEDSTPVKKEEVKLEPNKKFEFEPVEPISLPEPETKIKVYPKKIPKTGTFLDEDEIYKKAGIVGAALRKTIETKLPDKKFFRLAGSTNTDLKHWLEVLDKRDRNKNKYLVLPKQGLVIPINTVGEDTKIYDSFINGKEEYFKDYLVDGSVELPGTSVRGYGENGNKVIGGHSSYWKNGKSRYKTHFQKIIGMGEGEEIWVYEKNEEGKFERYVYKVRESYNTDDEDISVLKPTNDSILTLFTCTPIGGSTGRWIVKSEFVSKD